LPRKFYFCSPLLSGGITVRRDIYQLKGGAEVKFSFNLFGDLILISLKRDWRKQSFSIPTGGSIFANLSDGYQKRGWVTLTKSVWMDFLKSRHRLRTTRRQIERYWDGELGCVVIRDGDGQVLPFTKGELLEIAILRQSVSLEKTK
jgi:hypothetical protein